MDCSIRETPLELVDPINTLSKKTKRLKLTKCRVDINHIQWNSRTQTTTFFVLLF